MAGILLKITTAARGRGGSTFVGEVQTTMGVVLAMAAAAVVVHHFIATRAPRPAKQAAAPRKSGADSAASSVPAAAAAADPSASNTADRITAGRDAGSSAGTDGVGRRGSSDGVAHPASSAGGSGSSSSAGDTLRDPPAGRAAANASSSGAGARADSAPQREGKLTLREALTLLAGSLEIRCLAVMSLSQGLCTSLHEFAWKAHLRQLYPDPRWGEAVQPSSRSWSHRTTHAVWPLPVFSNV